MLLAANYQNVVDDSNGYLGTLGSATASAWMHATSKGVGIATRRTLSLSTGEVIWDLSGNALEWVQNCVFPTGMTTFIRSIGLSSTAKTNFGPKGTFLPSTSDALGAYGSANGPTTAVCTRGGKDTGTLSSGNSDTFNGLLYTGTLDIGTGKQATGFRCVYQP
jgi:hypothetical protein